MHTGDRMGGSVCKCMSCAGARFERAEREARTADPDKYFSYQRREDILVEKQKEVERMLKEVKNDKRDLIMTYYHKLVEEGK